LEALHDEEQEKLGVEGKAFIPARNGPERGFGGVNKELVGCAQRHNPQETATLDTDATLVEIHKADALWCCKRPKRYQSSSLSCRGWRFNGAFHFRRCRSVGSAMRFSEL
jgi:hypothetical protein